MYWDEKNERRSRDEMADFQTRRLKATVRYAFDSVDAYRRKFETTGVGPDAVNRLEDLAQLPFTTKADLRDHFPFGFCAVPRHKIARLHASSGTTGKPTPVFYTQTDLARWRDCMARNLTTAGVRDSDVCQIAFRYTLFTGAFGHHLGAEKIGALVIPTSSGQTERQIRMMADFNTTVLHCTPSYAITLAEKITAMGHDPRSLSLRLGIHGGEPMSEELRREVQERLGIIAIRDYGLTELGGPGVSIECPDRAGYHINEDHFYPEIIDPVTGQCLPEGELGELVLTTLQKEAMPVIRYRTRDITRLRRETCGCGRTLVRHGAIKGRTDDLLIIGGVNFYPSQLESLLLDCEEVAPHYVVRLKREDRRDRVHIDVETTTAFWACAGCESKAQLVGRIEAKLKDLIGLSMTVTLKEPFAMPRSEGKAVRVVDERVG